MIQSIKHKGLKRFFERGDGSKLNPSHLGKIADILGMLDAAHDVNDMDVPSFALHSLTGDFKGFHSVTVRSNWRIIFEFKNGDAYLIGYLDYH